MNAIVHSTGTLRSTALLLILLPQVGIAAAADPPVRAVAAISVPVRDLTRSVSFYREVLGFVPVDDSERSGDDYEHLYGLFGARVRVVTLQLGAERLKLEQFIAPQGRPIPPDSRSNDGWFQHIAIIVSDMDRAFAQLREKHVAFASTAPKLLPNWNPNAGGIQAFYFLDPDGHDLEILHFPPGKGDPKWQAVDRLFLGIDHSGRLVVIEIKATADLQLPFQALDYWLRVRKHLYVGDFERLGYFPGITISQEPPRILLAAPAGEFHSTSETLLAAFPPEIEVVRIGLGADWREELKVVLRLHGAARPQ